MFQAYLREQTVLWEQFRDVRRQHNMPTTKMSNSIPTLTPHPYQAETSDRQKTLEPSDEAICQRFLGRPGYRFSFGGCSILGVLPRDGDPLYDPMRRPGIFPFQEIQSEKHFPNCDLRERERERERERAMRTTKPSHWFLAHSLRQLSYKKVQGSGETTKEPTKDS